MTKYSNGSYSYEEINSMNSSYINVNTRKLSNGEYVTWDSGRWYVVPESYYPKKVKNYNDSSNINMEQLSYCLGSGLALGLAGMELGTSGLTPFSALAGGIGGFFLGFGGAWMQYNQSYGAELNFDDDFSKAEAATVRVDPLVLDLNGDGIKFNDAAFFDLDCNGFAELTGWVSEEDGFLAMDRNNNGIIDNGSELFGDRTISFFESIKQTKKVA